MSVLSDVDIRQQVANAVKYVKDEKIKDSAGFLLISPFEEMKKQAFGMSYGLSYCGYDLRLGGDEQSFIVPPGGFKLAVVHEYMHMASCLMGEIKDKSSWARKGIALQNTVIEPGWKGYITLEITNHSDKPVSFLKGMPICQIIFHKLSSWPSRTYDGKYQNQPNHPVEAIHEY